MRRGLGRALAVLGMTLGLTTTAAGQTLVGFAKDTLVLPSPLSGWALEFTGPPAGACAQPTGPLVDSFAVNDQTGPCGQPQTVGFTSGAVAVDPLRDVTYISNGHSMIVLSGDREVIDVYATLGKTLAPGYQLGMLSGLAFDTNRDVLWMTDGLNCVGVAPSLTCSPNPITSFPHVVFPPFAFSAPGGGGLMTGMTWHEPSGTLVTVDLWGRLWSSQAPPVDSPVPGFAIPTQIGSVLPDAACGTLTQQPTGIAFDRSTPGAVNTDAFYVTDGHEIVYVTLGGDAANPTFYTPSACFPVPWPDPIDGLAATSRAVTFGAGSDPTGLTPPRCVQSGQFTSPSGPLYVGVEGADTTPGTIAGLLFNVGPAPLGGAQLCPPLTALGGNGFLLGPPVFGPVGGGIPLTGGAGGFPTALPAGLPIGYEINAQWIVAKGSGGFQVSDGLSFTTALP